MKLNHLLSITLLLFASLIFTTCKKDPTKNAKLPPATQEGKNTVGFTIDDEVWVPYAECGFMRDPCREILARYGESGGAAPNGIDFGFTRVRDNEMSYLIITSAPDAITTVGEKIDSVSVIYSDNSLSKDGYFRGAMQGSKFIITKLDFQNQIISGQFEFKLREIKNDGTVTDNFIILKDGRFDFKFNACKCSR